MSLYYKIKRNLFPPEKGTLGFIPQFRLEGRSRDGDNTTGLEMRIADPLWMLGRQWQFGEFKGEDNGSPIGASANYRKEKINFYSFLNSESKKETGNIPLEARVEAVEIKPTDLRSKVRIGQKYEELIKAHFSAKESKSFINKLRIEFPLKLRLSDESHIKNPSDECIFVDKEKLKFPLIIRKWQLPLLANQFLLLS